MIDITKEDFESYITSASSATCEVFDKMQSYIYDAIINLEHSILCGIEYDNLDEHIKDQFNKCVCLSAFYSAIPDLDLVLTDTGFGVVSNNNLVPASKDRVVTLSQKINERSQDAYEKLLNLLLLYTDWREKNAEKFIMSLFFFSSQLKDFVGIDSPHQSDLVKLRPSIIALENALCNTISFELFERMLNHLRTLSSDNKLESLILKCRMFIGYSLMENSKPHDRSSLLENIENYIDYNIEDFPEYKNSKQYEKKHAQRYENKKEDSTFFFGS